MGLYGEMSTPESQRTMADLRNTAVGKAVQDAFAQFTTGSEKRTTVRTLDLTGKTLTFDVDMRSRHTRIIHPHPLPDYTIVLFDATLNSKGTIADVTAPKPEEIHIQVPLPAGQHVAFDMSHVIELVLVLL